MNRKKLKKYLNQVLEVMNSNINIISWTTMYAKLVRPQHLSFVTCFTLVFTPE